MSSAQGSVHQPPSDHFALEGLLESLSPSRLPAHRGEWLSLLFQHHDAVLDAYERLVLGGVITGEAIEGSMHFDEVQAEVMCHSDLKRHEPLYGKLARGYSSLGGQDRMAYLHGARKIYCFLRGEIKESEDIARRSLEVTLPNHLGISHLAIRQLQDESFQYRAVFHFMADRIAEAIHLQVPSPSGNSSENSSKDI